MFSCCGQDLRDQQLLPWGIRALGFYSGWDWAHSSGSGSAAGWIEWSRLQTAETAACGPGSSEHDGSPPGRKASPQI